MKTTESTKEKPSDLTNKVIDTIDFSSIDMYLRCGEQFRRRYVLGEKERPSIAMVDGTVYHAALAEGNRLFRDKGKLMTGKQLVDQYIKELRQEVADQKNAALNWEDENENSLHKKAKVLLPEYSLKYAPRITPDWVEQPVIHPVEIDGVKFKMAGVIDLTTKKSKNKNPLADRLVDYKTSSRPKSPDTARESLQLSIYSLVTKKTKVGFLTFVKSANPYVAEALSERTPPDLAWALQVAKRVFLSIQAGIFNLSNPDPRNWWCSEKFCGFWSTCRGKYVAMR